MKNEKCYTIETVPKSYRKIVEADKKLIPQTHLYMSAHFLGLLQALQ